MEIIYFENQTEIENLFRSSLRRKALIPIIGSGFTKGSTSKNGTVPDGTELQEIMIEEICRSCSEFSKNDFNSDAKFSEIANEFFKRVTKENYKRILRNKFTNIELDAKKKKLLDINFPYLYTLNIDDAIESNSKYKPIKPYKKLSNYVSELNCVFKMHGDVTDELAYDDLPNIIFSEDQYIKSLEKNSYMLNFFQSDYISKNILFIGCSLRDELDLKYAITTISDIEASGLDRIYITTTPPNSVRKSRLEDFGINIILVIKDYNDFYDYLFKIYDSLRFTEKKPFEIFKNPEIKTLSTALTENKNFLLDIAGDLSSSPTLPFYSVERDVLKIITDNIKNDVITVIAGKRFSGKSFLSKLLVSQLKNRDVYFFPSNVSLSPTEINDLKELENSYLIFDSNSLDVNNITQIERLIELFRKNNVYLIILCNRSDNLLTSAAALLTNKNYYNIEYSLTRNETTAVNKKLSEIGLINMEPSKSLIDNCLRAFDIYEQKIPFDVQSINDKEFMLTVILSSDGKIYSVLFNLLDIKKNDIDIYISKFSRFIERQSTNNIELHQHSGYKITSNSSGWLFKILNEYKINIGKKRTVNNISQLILTLTKSNAHNALYKKIINFDNLNQIFYGDDKGEAGLILELYENLEKILYEDNHFWLQRAKSIYNLKKNDTNSLRLAIDYAKKSYYDTTNQKLKINSTTTIALIYGRITVLTNFSSINDLENAIEWYYSALQENQFNRRYIDDILQKTKRTNNDIKLICRHLLENKISLNSNTLTRYAEFLINQVIKNSNP